MTGPYEWNPMPHRLDAKCPACRHSATFEFVEIVRIKRENDVSFFQNHRTLEYAFLKDKMGNGWHAALFFAGLRVTSTSAIGTLPSGYETNDWEHSPFLYRNHGTDLGTVSCLACGIRRKHILSWPSDAFYQTEYRGQVLWAFHRESAVDLRDYIASTDRDRTAYKWRSFLRHIPNAFLDASAREHVVKLLNRLIEGLS